eukprot:gene22072-49522_t
MEPPKTLTEFLRRVEQQDASRPTPWCADFNQHGCASLTELVGLDSANRKVLFRKMGLGMTEKMYIISAIHNLQNSLSAAESYATPAPVAAGGYDDSGATCYLNSLVQTLHHLPAFRAAIYSVPTADDAAGAGSVPLALQRLFYALESRGQQRRTACDTAELTRSFGWDSAAAGLLALLLDALGRHLPPEVGGGLLGRHLAARGCRDTAGELFRGVLERYITLRAEEFHELQLPVKRPTAYGVEHRDRPPTKHPAQTGIRLRRLPSVLVLHLRRFLWDVETMHQRKVCDRFAFPTELDLSRYVDDDDDGATYTLHAVMWRLFDDD